MNKMEANTQYNDMTGTAALDFKGGTLTEFIEYAKTKGIDTERYEPIGLKLYGGENNFFSISVFCIDLSKIDTYKQENNDRIPVVVVKIQETYEQFERLFKEFSVNLFMNVKKSEDYDFLEINE